MKQSEELIAWLIKQDVTTVETWLRNVWEGRESVPKDFYWPHLCAAIEVLARSGNGPRYYERPDLAWAKVAVSIYQYLIDQADPLTRMALEDRMMHLKAHLIRCFGNVPGDSMLDVDQIVEWFFQNLHLSFEDVEKISSWESLTTEELLRLRYIKNRLSILRFLADDHLIIPDERLRRWLMTQEKLP